MTDLPSSPSPAPSTADPQSHSINKRKRSSDEASPISSPRRPSSQPPPSAALPPPIIPYPQQHAISPHPHLVPFYPVYIPVPASSTSTPADQPRHNLSAASPIIPRHPTPPGYYRSTTSPTFYGHCPSSPASSSSSSIRPATADEREQARKVSHSAIERRRRERINDKIIQLRQLIPSCVDQEHLNKMTILQSAIDYITHLKKMVENKEGTHAESLKLDNLKIRSPRSMMPKEVAPFTTQFAVNPQPPPTPPSTAAEATIPATATAATAAEEEEGTTAVAVPLPPTRGIKPMDIIDGKTKDLPSAPVSLDDAGSGNMSVGAMLCGQ